MSSRCLAWEAFSILMAAFFSVIHFMCAIIQRVGSTLDTMNREFEESVPIRFAYTMQENWVIPVYGCVNSQQSIGWGEMDHLVIS